MNTTLDYESMLCEIESGSSGSVANVIRKLREHEVAAYQAGTGGPTGEVVARFLSDLDQRIVERNIEIEETCNYNYEGFADSTKELLSIEEESATLKNQLVENRESVKMSVEKLNDSSSKLSSSHVMLEHIDQCIDALQLCLPVVEQYSRVERSIAQGRYYHALKTLEHLERTQLEQIRAFAFSESLSSRIPKLRQEIKLKSLAELTDFLESIRKQSLRLGAIAMQQTARLSAMDTTTLDTAYPEDQAEVDWVESLSALADEQSSANCATAGLSLMTGHMTNAEGLPKELELLEQTAVGLPRLKPAVSSGTGGLSKCTEPVPRTTASQATLEELVDFGPVYRCLHIHSVLSEQTDFERHYCTQRRKQCQLSLSLSASQLANLTNYGEFFSGVVGFFVVDEHLRHTLPGNLGAHQTYLDELWAGTVQRLLQLAQANAAACKLLHNLVCLKDHCVLFARTMHGLGFPTTGLQDMLVTVKRRYEVLLAGQWRERFETIVTTDNYTAIVVPTETEARQLASLYPPSKSAADLISQAFPRSVAYSWMVPQIYAAVCDYIARCRFFARNMDLAWTELEDYLTRAANTLFTDCLNAVLMQAIRAAEVNLLRLIQLSVNVDELEAACHHLEVFIQHSVQPARLSDSAEAGPAGQRPIDVGGGGAG